MELENRETELLRAFDALNEVQAFVNETTEQQKARAEAHRKIWSKELSQKYDSAVGTVVSVCTFLVEASQKQEIWDWDWVAPAIRAQILWACSVADMLTEQPGRPALLSHGFLAALLYPWATVLQAIAAVGTAAAAVLAATQTPPASAQAVDNECKVRFAPRRHPEPFNAPPPALPELSYHAAAFPPFLVHNRLPSSSISLCC